MNQIRLINCTFEGIISTAGEGSCRSFSDTIGTQLVALLGSKPGKHWTSRDGAFIMLPFIICCGRENLNQKMNTNYNKMKSQSINMKTDTSEEAGHSMTLSLFYIY
jgi:hypothetical protein